MRNRIRTINLVVFLMLSPLAMAKNVAGQGDDNLTLVGVVSSETDRNIANISARSVPGVFSVKNDLRVVKR